MDKKNNREFYSCIFILLAAACVALLGVGCDVGFSDADDDEISGWLPGDISERERTGANVSLSELIPGADGKLYEGEFAFFAAEGMRSSGAAEILAAHELSRYQTPYGDAKSDIFYSSMDADARLVYDMLIYAFDNGYERACFSSRTLNGDDVAGCVKLLAADHPFFEASMELNLSSVTCGSASGPVTFFSFSLSSLDAKNRQQKMDAYIKAQEILQAVQGDGLAAGDNGLAAGSDGLAAGSDGALALALYSYVTHNIEYEEMPTPSYLYDALVSGKTVCDGYAEAVCLLYNLAGIECACVPGEVTGTGAHAWNIAKIDGEYTQLDATFDASAGVCLYPGCPGVYFRLSDEQMLSDRSYDSFIGLYAPKCADGSYFDSLTGYTASNFNSADGEAIAEAFAPRYLDGARAFVIQCDTVASITNELVIDMAQAINNNLAGRIDAQRLGYQLIDERKLMVLLAE